MTEEQPELKALARKFSEQEIIPRAREYDDKEIFPRDICAKAFAAGLMNFGVPKEFGGPGLEHSRYLPDSGRAELRMLRDLEFRSAPTTSRTLPLLIAGNDEQKRTYLGAPDRRSSASAHSR